MLNFNLEDYVRREFERFLRRFTLDNPVPGLDRISLENNYARGEVIILLHFINAPRYNIAFGREILQQAPPYRGLSTVLTTVWWQCYEDYQINLLTRERREQVEQLVRNGASPPEVHFLQSRLAMEEAHIRAHHAYRIANPPLIQGGDYGVSPGLVGLRFCTTAGPEDEARWKQSREAEKRAEKLLLDALTEDQRKEFEETKSFTVVGSHSGKRYRIRHGRQMNIDELDKDGEKVCGWCFLPSGGLVAGDCMLAQKIALETDEKEALRIANKFPIVYEGALDGIVNWEPRSRPWRWRDIFFD